MKATPFFQYAFKIIIIQNCDITSQNILKDEKRSNKFSAHDFDKITRENAKNSYSAVKKILLKM